MSQSPRRIVQVYGWVYRYDSPDFSQYVKLMDAIKLCLIHHKIEYRILPGIEHAHMLIEIDNVALDALFDDQTFASINDQLEKLYDETR